MAAILYNNSPENLPAVVSFLVSKKAALWPRAQVKGEGEAQKTALEMAQERNMLNVAKILIESMVLVRHVQLSVLLGYSLANLFLCPST